jgi:hypothetical protein
MAVRLSDIHAGRSLPPGRFLVFNSVRGWVNPRAKVRPKCLGKLKKIQWPYRELNPRPSGLQHMSSTNYATTYHESVKFTSLIILLCVSRLKSLKTLNSNISCVHSLFDLWFIEVSSWDSVASHDGNSNSFLITFYVEGSGFVLIWRNISGLICRDWENR